MKQSQSNHTVRDAVSAAVGVPTTFDKEFEPALLFLEELAEDVRNGEIGTDVVYLHPSALERHWKAWGKDALVAVIGGVAGGVIGFLSASG